MSRATQKISLLVIKLFFPVFFILSIITTPTHADFFDINFDYVCPYAGFDGQYRWVNPNSKTAFTIPGRTQSFLMSQLSPRAYPGFNAYLGGRYECMGLEVGGHYGAAKKSFDSLNILTRFAGGYVDLVGYLPTCENIELMGTLGVGYTSSRATFTNPVGGGFDLGANSGTVVPRLRLGGNYMFNYWAGVRALVGYESTNLLELNTSNGVINPFGDSLLGSVGVFVKF